MASQARASMWVVALNPDGSAIAPAQQVIVPVNVAGAASNNAPTTSPGAAALIAQIPLGSVTADTWDVTVTAVIGGTVAAADIGNMVLTANGVTARLAVSDTTSPVTFPPIRVKTANGANINVSTVGAGTAGSVYAATISATRVV